MVNLNSGRLTKERIVDWVQKRAQRECAIQQSGEMVWFHLCGALAHAVESYSKLYSEGFSVSFSGPQDSRSWIRLSGTRQDFVELVFDQESGAIVLRRENAEFRRLLVDVVEGDQVAIFERLALFDKGYPVSIEAASQLILEPLLFPTQGSGPQGAQLP